MRTRLRRLLPVVVALLALTGLPAGAPAAGPAYLPPARHVFVINLENKGYDETWGQRTDGASGE